MTTQEQITPRIADVIAASGEVFQAPPSTSAVDYLERMNGRAKLDVPSVRGEHKVDMRGTVPDSWSLS